MSTPRQLLSVVMFTGTLLFALATAFAPLAAASIGCEPAEGNWCQEEDCCTPYWPEAEYCQTELNQCGGAQSCYDAYDTCVDDVNFTRDVCFDHFEPIFWCYEV